MFIEIDMERIEDRSKALSYIGIEIAESLKYIPTPVSATEEPVTNRFEEKIPEKVVHIPLNHTLLYILLLENSFSLDIPSNMF